MKYRIVIEQTLTVEVTADSKGEAYEKYHNRNEYDSLEYNDETTVGIYAVEDEEGV